MPRPTIIPTHGTATGGNVVTGLVPTSATWLSNALINGVTYGLVLYQLNAANLSAVLPGHRLTVTGFVNAANNGSNMVIVSADDTLNQIIVRMTERPDGVLNETGVTGAGTVTDDGAQLKRPSVAKQAQGFIPGEKPGAGHLNWQFNYIGQWLSHYSAALPVGFELLQARLTADPTTIAITDNGDGTQKIAALISNAQGVTRDVTQASHGFTVGKAVRHNGTTWVTAKADTVAGTKGVWIVVAAATNTFTAMRTGIVTLTGHGLGSAGATLFLSADTAGALTSTRPVGNTTRPLGYYLQVANVIDANTLEILGGNATFNPVYAEYLATGDVTINTLAFTVDLNNVGNSIRIVGAAQNRDVNGVGTVELSFGANFGATAYLWMKQQIAEDSPWAITPTETTSTNSFRIADGCGPGGSPDYNPFGYTGQLYRTAANGSSSTIASWVYCGRALQEVDTVSDYRPQIYDGWVRPSSTAGNNITTISFTNSVKCRLRAGDRIQLLIDRMPDA